MKRVPGCVLHTVACVKSYTRAYMLTRNLAFASLIPPYESNCNETECAILTFPHIQWFDFNKHLIEFRIRLNSLSISSIFFLSRIFLYTIFLSPFSLKTDQPRHVNDHHITPGNNLGKHKHPNRRSETFDALYMRARGRLYVSMRCPEGPKGP